MIEHGCAATGRELSEADEGAAARSFRCALCPDLVMRDEPGEQVDVLRLWQVTGQCLVEMMMRVDQARQNDLTREVNHEVRRVRQFRRGADLLDDAVAREDRAVLDLASFVVHRYEDFCVPGEECAHDEPPLCALRPTACWLLDLLPRK